MSTTDHRRSAGIDDTAERVVPTHRDAEETITYDAVRAIIGIDPSTLSAHSHRDHMEARGQAAWLREALAKTVGAR